MKTILTGSLITLLLTSSLAIFAQNHTEKSVQPTTKADQPEHAIQPTTLKSGIVEFNEKMALDIHFDGDAQADLPRLPKEHTSRRVLYFTPEATLYENIPEEENMESVEEMEGGHRMIVKIDQPDEKTYIDIVNRKITDQREFMSRMFLVESPVDTFSWKFTGNQREILGYPCNEAVWMHDSVRTIAWFTPSIPVEAGPARFSGLPGLILEVITNEGKRIITATSVKLGEVADRISKPAKGKKMTREAFNKMVDEKRKESGEEGGNHVVIRVRR